MNTVESIEILSRRSYVRTTAKVREAVKTAAEQVRQQRRAHDIEFLKAGESDTLVADERVDHTTYYLNSNKHPIYKRLSWDLIDGGDLCGNDKDNRASNVGALEFALLLPQILEALKNEIASKESQASAALENLKC